MLPNSAVEDDQIMASCSVFIYRVKALSWFARMMSSGDGVSNRNGGIGDSEVDSSWCSPPSSWWSLPVPWLWICPSSEFLLFRSLWLWKERAHAKTDGLAKTEGVRESDSRAPLKLSELKSSGCSITTPPSTVCLGLDDLGFLWLGLCLVTPSLELPAGAQGAAKEACGSGKALAPDSARRESARCCRVNSVSATPPPKDAGVMVELRWFSGFPGIPSWMCVFLPWCCAASSDRESICAGAVAIFALGLQFECSWIRSDNDGLPLGWAILAWPPTPGEDWLTPLVDKRDPRLNPGIAKDELVVVTELLSERLLSGIERRDGAELWAPEGIFKDAKVPSERLFWLHIMEEGDVDPLVRALNEGSLKLCPASPFSLLFCTCPDVSCDRLIPLRSGQRLCWAKPLMSELLPNLCCGKSVGKFNACCFLHFCACTEPLVCTVCASAAVSVWATEKQSPYLTKAKSSCRRAEAEGAQKSAELWHKQEIKRHFVSTWI